MLSRLTIRHTSLTLALTPSTLIPEPGSCSHPFLPHHGFLLNYNGVPIYQGTMLCHFMKRRWIQITAKKHNFAGWEGRTQKLCAGWLIFPLFYHNPVAYNTLRRHVCVAAFSLRFPCFIQRIVIGREVLSWRSTSTDFQGPAHTTVAKRLKFRLYQQMARTWIRVPHESAKVDKRCLFAPCLSLPIVARGRSGKDNARTLLHIGKLYEVDTTVSYVDATWHSIFATSN